MRLVDPQGPLVEAEQAERGRDDREHEQSDELLARPDLFLILVELFERGEVVVVFDVGIRCGPQALEDQVVVAIEFRIQTRRRSVTRAGHDVARACSTSSACCCLWTWPTPVAGLAAAGRPA